MKAALVLRGGPLVPDLAKAKRYGVTRLYWEADDPQITAKLLDDVRAKGFEIGLMRDPSWHADNPQQLAKKLSDDLIRFASPSFFPNPKQCAVQADIEYHSAQYVIDFITEWRKLRSARETAWTMEPNQGGWFTPELVDRLNRDQNMMVLPQLYYGDMSPAVESLMTIDIERRGVNPDRIRCYYGLRNRQIADAWDGALFDLISLP